MAAAARGAAPLKSAVNRKMRGAPRTNFFRRSVRRNRWIFQIAIGADFLRTLVSGLKIKGYKGLLDTAWPRLDLKSRSCSCSFV